MRKLKDYILFIFAILMILCILGGTLVAGYFALTYQPIKMLSAGLIVVCCVFLVYVLNDIWK